MRAIIQRVTARVRRSFALPLLAKELTEAAARRRTFIIRIVYVVLLYGAFAAMMPNELFNGKSGIPELMGLGSGMFESLCILQVSAVALFLPALMSGRIAQEKERDSLVLLMLTELRPGQIVLQKYFGGLVPMLSFLLLGLPLAAIAYSFGGLTSTRLIGAAFALLILTLQIGAMALLCSAWCRTTASAFIGTYFLGALIYAGPPILLEFARMLHLVSGHWRDLRVARELSVLLIPLAAFEAAEGDPWPKYLLQLAPSVLSVFVLLGLARFFLVRRAFLPPGNFSLRLFRKIDRLMLWANRFFGNITLLRDKTSLPQVAPIYWRETARRTLGKAHYLIRILVLIEIPTVFLCALVTVDFGSRYSGQADELSGLLAVLMALAVLGISVQAANTVVSERVQQTLEVLLTTPLSAREIVLQKVRAVRRLLIVVAIPVVTVMGVECWLERGLTPRYRMVDGWLAYAVSAGIIIGIFLPMIVWLSLWIGLEVRTRFRAIVTALAVIVAWCFVPIGLLIYLGSSSGYSRQLESWLLLFSPLAFGILNEGSQLNRYSWESDSPWPAIAANALLYGALTLFFRQHVLKNADRWLRR